MTLLPGFTWFGMLRHMVQLPLVSIIMAGATIAVMAAVMMIR